MDNQIAGDYGPDPWEAKVTVTFLAPYLSEEQFDALLETVGDVLNKMPLPRQVNIDWEWA